MPITDVRAQNFHTKKAKKKKKIGVTDFVLEGTCPRKYPKSEKSGFDCY